MLGSLYHAISWIVHQEVPDGHASLSTLCPDPTPSSVCYHSDLDDLAVPSSMTGGMEPWKHNLNEA